VLCCVLCVMLCMLCFCCVSYFSTRGREDAEERFCATEFRLQAAEDTAAEMTKQRERDEAARQVGGRQGAGRWQARGRQVAGKWQASDRQVAGKWQAREEEKGEDEENTCVCVYACVLCCVLCVV
jgi:hypothetical protein